MKTASAFIGAAVVAASLALAAPAAASPAPTPGLSDAVSTAAAAPGVIASNAPKSTLSVQDADHGSRIGTVTAGGFYSKPAIDGTTTQSAFYKPAM